MPRANFLRYERPVRLSSRLPIQIAVHHLRGVAMATKRPANHFGHHDRAMTAPGAAKGDGQIALSFADVVRDQIGQQSFDPPQELAGLR